MDTTRYPIGIQTFETLRNERCVYADKTGYVYRLVTSASRTFFLSRPRRFGKSLLLSTIEAYFRGRRELFEGLAIYGLEKEWRQYPVLRFDFSQAEAKDSKRLQAFVSESIKAYAREYDVTLMSEEAGPGPMFGSLIKEVALKTGSQVVILIDEYDKGIHEVLGNEPQLAANQDVLRPFFSQIKAQGEYLRFCLITGVARFRNYTLFSGFNNPDDISMDPRYAGICGITQQELIAKFGDGIQALADSMGTSRDETIDLLRQKYDGYRFTAADELVYNPFSIINCLEKCMMENYWVTSGTPKVFVDYLAKSQFDLLELENLWVTKVRMEGTYSTEDPIPLLFQTGYLTIKECDMGMYRLGIPNGEVRSALVDDLIPRYMGIDRNTMPLLILKVRRALASGNVDGLMTVLQQLVASIPYHQMDIPNIEKTYHLVIYELFLIIGADARSEVAISGGRIDLVVQNSRYVYVIEFKLDGTADEALAQIDDRGYALPWSADGNIVSDTGRGCTMVHPYTAAGPRKVFKIGAVFSGETRTISDWKSVEA